MTDFMFNWQSEATVNLSTPLQRCVFHLICEVWKVCDAQEPPTRFPSRVPIMLACGGAAVEINTHQTPKINTFITLRCSQQCRFTACYIWLEAEIPRCIYQKLLPSNSPWRKMRKKKTKHFLTFYMMLSKKMTHFILSLRFKKNNTFDCALCGLSELPGF